MYFLRVMMDFVTQIKYKLNLFAQNLLIVKTIATIKARN